VSDVLARGDDVARVPGRGRAIAVLVLVLALLGGAADRWQVSRERGQLLRSVTAGERAVDASQSSIASLAEYSAGLLYAADVPASARSSAYENLAEDAGRWRPRLERVRSEVEATRVLPWHRESRAARTAYERRLTAWIDLLADFASRPQGRLGGDEAAVTASRRAASEALVAAGIDRRRIRELLG
jgi:hypothetical protein